MNDMLPNIDLNKLPRDPAPPDTWQDKASCYGIALHFKKTASGPRRLQLEKYMRVARCPTCQGLRLNPQARAVRVAGRSLVEVEAMPLGDPVG